MNFDADSVAIWIGGAWLATLTWIAQRFVTKVDAKADSTMVADAMKQSRETLDRIFLKLDELSETIQQTNVELARLEGRSDG